MSGIAFPLGKTSRMYSFELSTSGFCHALYGSQYKILVLFRVRRTRTEHDSGAHRPFANLTEKMHRWGVVKESAIPLFDRLDAY